MLKKLIFTVAAAIALCGCGNSNDNNGQADSELSIRANGSSTVISSPENRGAITIDVGQQRDFDIFRTVREGTVQPVTTEVTGDVDFNFSEPSVASMDANGRLSGLTAGFTELEVVYRDGDTDPTDDDKVYLDVTVLPN
jgi:hypothetical protein